MSRYGRRPRRFRTGVVPTVTMMFFVVVFCGLGFWQLERAEQKQLLRAAYIERARAPAIRIGPEPLAPDTVRYARVVVSGRYEPDLQFYVANRVHERRLGYHVITPLRIDGGEMRLLVNRGWVPRVNPDRVPPKGAVPAGHVLVRGLAVVPQPNRVAERLAGAPKNLRQAVWPTLNIDRYRKLAPFPVQPFVVLLDPREAGGFARQWPRLDRLIELRPERNVSYAVQWFVMAVAAVIIYVVFGLRRR